MAGCSGMEMRNARLILLLVLLCGIGLWLVPNQPRPSAVAQRGASAVEEKAEVVALEPNAEQAPQPESGLITNDPVPEFPQAVIRAEHIEPRSEVQCERRRLLDANGPFPHVRTIEYFRKDAAGNWQRERTEAMLADSVLVTRPEGTTPEAFEADLAALGFKAGTQYSFSPAVRAFIPGEVTLDGVVAALDRLQADAASFSASPDYLQFSQRVPNEYDERRQWGLAKMQAPVAWATTTGSSSLVAGIIDSGMNRQHPDLASNVWTNPGEVANGRDDDGNGLVDDLYGWDFAASDNDPSDENSHGTHVAGIIGGFGNNGLGVTGVAWRVKLLALRCGDQSLATSAVIQGMDYLSSLKQSGVPIVAVNNSYTSTSSISTQRDSIVRARDAGILFVAAAGNDSRDVDGSIRAYPVCYGVENIIGVAASNHADMLADYSNWGEGSVHLAAPGSGIWSTVLDDGYGIKDGTSMAAPMVTGALVLLKASHPELEYSGLKQALLAGTVALSGFEGRVATGGRLDLARLIAPTVAIPSIAFPTSMATVIGVESPNPSLELSVRAVQEIGGVEQGVLPVVWEKISGPGSVEFSAATGDVTTLRFSMDGLYQIRAFATVGELTAAIEKTVVVGSAQVGSDDLLAQWRFAEESGAAVDSSGNGRTAELKNDPTRDVGPGGLAALRFNGVSTVAEFAAPAPSKTTLTGWMYMDTKGNSVFPRLVHSPTYYLFPGRDQSVSPKAPDANRGSLKFLAHWTDVDGVYYSEPDLVTDGRWYHMAATYDGTRGIFECPRLFLDGKPLGVATQAAASGSFAPTPGKGYLGNNDTITRALDGRLADVRIYGRELLPSEIALLAAEPALASIRGWSLVVVSNDQRSAVIQLRKEDGRVPNSDQSVMWRKIEGPSLATFSHASDGEVNVSVPISGSYTVTVGFGEGPATMERQFTIDLPGVPVESIPPSIGQQPTSMTVAVGTMLQLEVESAGSPPLVYQWFKDGEAIAGATSAQFLRVASVKEDAGIYTVRISNSGGAVTSAPVDVLVLDPPVIVTSPANRSIAIGSRLELSVVASGSPPLEYQWWHGAEKVAGATTPTLSMDAVGVDDAGQYSVTVRNAVGVVESDFAAVEVLEPPSIVTQPESQTVIAGSTVQLTVTAAGAVPRTFQWYKDGQPIAGATKSNLRFVILQESDSGEYTIKVSNSVGEVIAQPFILRVLSKPKITQQLGSQFAHQGERVVLEVVATGSAPLTYKWYHGTALIGGQNGPQYVIESLQKSDEGPYKVQISNEVGSVTSSMAYVELLVPPQLLREPEDQPVTQGALVTLTVMSDGSGGGYRWMRNGQVVSGATANQLRIDSVQPENAGLYVAEVSSYGGTTSTFPAVVGVRPTGRTAGAVETRPEWQGIVHPNGNIYDQFLLTGAAGTITAEAGKIARISFLDEDSDIVQVELSGAGAVTVCLANATGPQAPLLYNQPDIVYYQGKPTVILVGADATTHMSIYSVGRLNNPGVTLPDVPYDGWSDVGALGIVCPSGTMGGLYLGNVAFGTSAGPTGIVARTVKNIGTVRLHDITASGTALPFLRFASEGQIQATLTGGSLAQSNNQPVDVGGVISLIMAAGSGSSGQEAPAQSIGGRLVRAGVDVTETIVVPAP